MVRAILAVVLLAALLVPATARADDTWVTPDEPCRVEYPLPNGPGGVWMLIRNDSDHTVVAQPYIVNGQGEGCSVKMFGLSADMTYMTELQSAAVWCPGYPKDVAPWVFRADAHTYTLPGEPYVVTCLEYVLFEPKFIQLSLIRDGQ
jgi:hypothetical protein